MFNTNKYIFCARIAHRSVNCKKQQPLQGNCNVKVKTKNQMHLIRVSMYSARKYYLKTLYLLEKGPPFYVAIRATQRSSQLQSNRVPSFLSCFTTKTKKNHLFKKTVFPVESFFFVYFFLTNDKNITPNPNPHIKIYVIIMKKPKESPIIQEFKMT